MTEPAPLRFGPFELRPERRELLQHGAPLALGARAFDVLLLLVTHRDRFVAKAELLTAVWAGRVVEENNLTVQISTLRKLLGADTIATNPGRGYRFTADVLPAASAAPAAPSPKAALYGREADTVALQQALATARLVTVLGAAGMGKTALAKAYVDAIPRGGAWWVELATLPSQPEGSTQPPDTTTLAAAIAAALALAPSAQPPLERLLQHLRQWPTAVLPVLVLDNCEHLVGAVAALVHRLQAAVPALQVLATSQVPLRLLREQLLRLEPLAVPVGADLAQARACGAVALFVARATAAAPGFALADTNAGEVLDICRRLEGIPLALELAAARVPLLGTAGVHQRLSERFRLLARAAPATPARHQTLQAALDWSHSLLPEPEQRLLRRLALFVGGFTAASAQQLAEDADNDEWTVLDGLGALVDKSLVVAQRAGTGGAIGEPRFTMLETVRDYARVQLALSADAAPFAQRHAQLFAALAAAHAGLVGGEQAGARRTRLESDHDNLRAALDWATTHQPSLGLHMAASLLPFWRERGHHAEALQRCAALLAGTDARADALARLPVQIGIGSLAVELGDAATAQTAGEAALAGARSTGQRLQEAFALAMLAHASGLRGEITQSRLHFEACLRIHRETGDARLIAEGLNNVASVWCSEGQPQQALPLLLEALPLARASGHRWTEAAVLQTLGEVDIERGDHTAARQHLEQALVLRRGLHHQFQLVMALQSLAIVELNLHALDSAASRLREALQLCASHGFAGKAAEGLAACADWAAAWGRGEDATLLLGAAQARGALVSTEVMPAERALHARALVQAQALLGGDGPVWQQTWQRGLGLTQDAALALALRVLGPQPPASSA